MSEGVAVIEPAGSSVALSGEAAGVRRLVGLAFPMLVNMGALSFSQLVNRLFLSWESEDAIAAAGPAVGVTHALFCVFFGTALYTSAFVAQYFGAGRPERIGSVVRAGLCVALVGQLTMASLSLFAEEIFTWIGHEPAVRELETSYFRVSCFGVGGLAAGGVLGAVYSGRGLTRPIMWMGGSMALLNVVLDYGLIFGELGLPRLGMVGAAWATVTCQWLGCSIWALLVFSRRHAAFRLWRGFGDDRATLARLLRFGLPSGVHFFLDGVAWTGFSLIVGQLGTKQLAASNIAWQIHTLALLPILGIGGAASILVAQFQGARRPDLGRLATGSALRVSLAYMTLFAVTLLLGRDLWLLPFSRGGGSPEALELAVSLLPFVAALGFAHSVQMIFASALKGAGDVRFIMGALALSATVGFLLPLLWLVSRGFELQALWIWFVAITSLMAGVFALRFRSGAWTERRLIEEGEER